ncbi:hypothetical protein [Poritiphilus flavus]|uniref:Por secretion system C-terminal sorting domain-containing protein n=1 Tax=Poritiphilus flavus TaxID=2697053 RepID=A0A6L9EBQ6_9FLAO|nr:hypothetical protein [Poritiphilus flavus]NAS11839.1 hypothetical protein [Poritiphilus flavus]
MKVNWKITTVVAALFISMTGLAKEAKHLLEIGTEGKSLIFKLPAQSAETKISLFDPEGRIIFSDAVEDQEFYAKRFDLDLLEEGVYSMKVENTLREITYSIDIDEPSVEILAKKERTKPVFRKTEDKVFLNLLNLEGNSVSVKVIDGNGRMLYKEVFKGDLLIEKAFNFEKAFDDSYTLVVKDDQNTYYETIVVN